VSVVLETDRRVEAAEELEGLGARTVYVSNLRGRD